MLVLVTALSLALSTSATPLPAQLDAPRIVITKAGRQLELYSGPALLRTYRVGLGLSPVPPKRRAGDNATPEGSFRVTIKNPRSRFYLSLGLSYPGPEDAARGLREGLITKVQHDGILEASGRGRTPTWNTALGGEIFIHGRGSSSDWTWGCIALDDPDMRELFNAVPVGTPVEILP